MRKAGLFALLFAVLGITTSAHAQFDAAFGVSTVTAPRGTSSFGFQLPSLAGGAYPAFGATILLKKQFGVGGEVSWRASQNVYGGFQPYRPILYDFNAVYAPRMGKTFGADLMAGIGGEDLRFYQPFFSCGFTGCTNYISSNHFLGHFGAGIRYYVYGNLFIRPEAHLYIIHNNVEFNSAYAGRFGVSIGYRFGPGF